MSVLVNVRMTQSQHMALVELVAAYMRQTDEAQVFVDVLRDVETTTPELLQLLMNERAWEVAAR